MSEACLNCPYKGAPRVGTKGPEDSPFVIVGESPGIMEVAKGKPFVGNSGKLLHSVLEECHFPQDIEPYFLNAVECLPRNKDLDNLKEACHECNPRVRELIGKHPRKLILALGNAALWATTGNYSLKITGARGKVYPSNFAEHGIVAAMHPASLLRGTGNLPQFRMDIKYAIGLLTRGSDALKLPNGATYTVAKSIEQVLQICEELKTAPICAADIETSHLHFRKGRILALGLQYEPSHVWVIPPQLITPRLFNDYTRYVWHNGKFDVKWLREHYKAEVFVDEDTMLLSYSLNEKRGIHDLDQVASDWLGTEDHKDMLKPWLPNREASYELVPPEVLYHYLALDMQKTYGLYYKLRPLVAASKDLNKLYTKVLLPASEYLSRMETKGIQVDLEWNQTIRRDLLTEVAELWDKLDDEAVKAGLVRQPTKIPKKKKAEFDRLGESFFRDKLHAINPNSPKQLKEFLYGRLKLGPISLSTDADTLEALPPHPAVAALIRYREIHKAYSTYVKALPDIAAKDPLDGTIRIHSTYLLHGTATGRLSSREPNLQNIPRHPLYRGQFIADQGFVFLEPDLSQAELRSLACLSGDPGLVEIFCASDRSLHDEVATEFFGKGFDEEQKMIAKNVNFGIVYGITALGLYMQLDTNGIATTMAECQSYIDRWYGRFPVAHQFILACRESVVKGTTITTIFGRKKRHGVVARERLKDLQNEASNFPHQSIASDITLTTGARIRPAIESYGAYVQNTVHDSILVGCPRNEETINVVGKMLIDELQATPRMVGLTKVPFKAEAKVGLRWGSIKAAKKLGLENAHEFLTEWAPNTPLPEYLLNG